MSLTLNTILDAGISINVIPNDSSWTCHPTLFNKPGKPLKTSPGSSNYYSCPVGPAGFEIGIYRDYGDVVCQLGNRDGSLKGTGMTCTGFSTLEETEVDWAHVCSRSHKDEEHQRCHAAAKQQAEEEAANAHAAVVHSAIERLHLRLVHRMAPSHVNGPLTSMSLCLLRQTPPPSPSQSRSLGAPPSSPSSSCMVRYNGILVGWVLYVGSLDGVTSYPDLVGKSAHDALKVALSEGPASIILAQDLDQALEANRQMQLNYAMETARLEDEP
ncbi:hypothetical protein PQX77_016789 [Marasmius sp. AFHP31]|nr:hypothetical protein PQX77_016789 [Marasmius sp. AFHP31]